MYSLPMNRMPDSKQFEKNMQVNSDVQNAKMKDLPVIYEGSFTLNETGDTFVDMETWGKGIVFVNGKNLGRYWNVGPQQTLYLPGVWLKKGENRIVVFEQLNETPQKELKTVKLPVLNKLK